MSRSPDKISGREPAIGRRSRDNAPALGGVPGAVRQLQDPDATVRLAAVEKLLGYREKAVASLGQLLLDRQGDPDVHLLAIYVLERIGTARAQQAIGLGVRSPRHSVSLTAQAALARLGKQPSRLRALAERLTGQSPLTWNDLDQRLQQVLAASSSKDGAPLEATIREFLRLGPEGAARLLAATANTSHALATVHGLALVAIEPAPRRELAMELLARFLNHLDRKVVRLAAQSLATVGAPAVDLLVDSLACGDAASRAQVVAALGALRQKKALQALVKALRDEEPRVRQAAALALESRAGGLPAPVQAELAVFRRDGALLSRLGKQAVPALLRALAAGELDPVWTMSWLAMSRDERAIPALREHLRSDNYRLREAAAYAMAEIGHRSVVPALQEACHDPHERVRKAADRALAQFVGY